MMVVQWLYIDEYVQEILDGLTQLRQQCQSIDRLFTNLATHGDLIVIGGALRDLAIQQRPRDIDLIVDTEQVNLESALAGLTYRRNRFGGYKVWAGDMEFDIWSIQSNWAFQKQLFTPCFQNITRGTFFNFDGLCLHLTTKILDCAPFRTSVTRQELDILLDEKDMSLNPTPATNIVRALILQKKWQLRLSYKVQRYIADWLKEQQQPIEALRQAERTHYGTNGRLSQVDYDKLLIQHA